MKYPLMLGSQGLAKKTIELNKIGKTYGDTVLFKDFTYTVNRDDRIGIIGPNGAGKTTLLNVIIGSLELSTGSVEIGDTINIGYFSQEAKDMPLDIKGIDYIKDTAEYIKTESGYQLSASVMLERFLFDDELQYAPISSMSGGERRRLYLLKTLMLAPPNVLILDEPTNDLDIDTLKILEAYIDDFSGIVIAVSHDRYFLDRVCNKIFSFETNHEIVPITGNYSDYQNYRKNHMTLSTTVPSNNNSDGTSVKEKKLRKSKPNRSRDLPREERL